MGQCIKDKMEGQLEMKMKACGLVSSRLVDVPEELKLSQVGWD